MPAGPGEGGGSRSTSFGRQSWLLKAGVTTKMGVHLVVATGYGQYIYPIQKRRGVQNDKYRALVALGVASIGTSTTAAFSHGDSVRYASLSAAQLASAADAATSAGGPPGMPP